MEKSDVFFGGAGAGAGSAFANAVSWVEATGFGADAVEAWAAVLLMGFFFVFRATDRGLNSNGFPTSLTSSAGFIVSGIDGSAGRLGGGKLRPDAPSVLLLELLEGSSSRLNPFSALVLRLMPGRLKVLPSIGFPVFFGGGRNELNPEKTPPPPVRARFAGGSLLLAAPASLEEET